MSEESPSSEGIVLDLSEGTIRVSASYGLKLGKPDYSSEDAHTSFSLELPLPADASDVAGLARALVEVHASLRDGAKLATLNELDQGFYTTGDGVLRPSVFGGEQIPVASAPATPPSVVAAAPVEQAVAPVAPATAAELNPVTGAVEASPSVTAPAGQVYGDFGKGVQMYYDNREKKSSGQWKPNASDFSSVNAMPDGQRHSVWINGPQGNPNSAVAAAMSQWGIN
jgi:hypothetical protein